MIKCKKLSQKKSSFYIYTKNTFKKTFKKYKKAKLSKILFKKTIIKLEILNQNI